MKILVPTKRVPDTDQKIAASADGSHVAIDHLPFVINPFDAIALEEAVRISERLPDVEVVAVGIGAADYEPQLRTALAMGASRAIRVECSPVIYPSRLKTERRHLPASERNESDVQFSDANSIDPWNVARLLRAVVERERPDLVIMGKQAVDDDANQTGQFLAALLDWPQATFASRVELVEGEIRVERETDYGIETVILPLPAVVTSDLRLNEPRYASMAGIMKARKKPLDTILAEDLGVTLAARVEIIRYHSAETQRRCERIGSVDELVDRLHRVVGII